jgi:hypothetical protein
MRDADYEMDKNTAFYVALGQVGVQNSSFWQHDHSDDIILYD